MLFKDNEANRNLAKRIFLKNLDECVLFPKYFELETVHACNARCIMCTLEKWPKSRNTLMSTELFSRFASEVSSYSNWIETICLNRDGEPTLDKKIAEKVKILKEVGIKRLTLTTNAQLLSPELIESLIQSGLDDIMVSIDGTTKKSFEQIRVGLNFETVKNNTMKLIQIRNEMRSKMTIRIRMVILKENEHEVEEFLRFWGERKGVEDRVYAMPAHTWGNQIQLKGICHDNNPITEPCVFLFSSMAIHADGRVSLCNADYGIKYLMGDLREKSIKEIWNDEPYNRIRKLHSEGLRDEIDLCIGCNLWNRNYLEKK